MPVIKRVRRLNTDKKLRKDAAVAGQSRLEILLNEKKVKATETQVQQDALRKQMSDEVSEDKKKTLQAEIERLGEQYQQYIKQMV